MRVLEPETAGQFGRSLKPHASASRHPAETSGHKAHKRSGLQFDQPFLR